MEQHPKPGPSGDTIQRDSTVRFSPLHDSHPKSVRVERREPLSQSSSNELSPRKMHHLMMRPKHRYMIRRPRPIQYTHHSTLITVGEEDAAGGHVPERIVEKTESASSEHSSHRKHGVHELIEKQRERLDLFIDLIWVGIITNISDIFSSKSFSPDDPNTGHATLYILIVFLPSWRIWNSMREFMNTYYMDDLLQRFFIFWIIALTVFYGNNLAYVTERPIYAKTVTISLYLVIRTSLFLLESIYSVFIPWLRWESLLSFFIYLPSTGLWIAAIYLSESKSVGPILAAIALDYAMPVIMESPLRRKILPGDRYKEIDPHHFTNRMANFFIIVLGEGILQLVRNGPLGVGVTRTAGYSLWGLTIYFLLAFTYFNGDSSQTFVPAVRHKGWRTIVWLGWHIPMFAFTLTLSAAIMFIIRDTAAQLDNVTEPETIPAEELPTFIRRAIWTIAISLAGIVLSMTALALLDEPVDKPDQLRVNNRYIRLSARGIYVLIIVLVPIDSRINPDVYLGICGILMTFISIWEWNVSMEKNWRFFEPKPKTHIITPSRSDDSEGGEPRFRPEQGTAALLHFPVIFSSRSPNQNPTSDESSIASPT